MFNKHGFDEAFVKAFIRVFKKHVKRGALVVGGGRVSREYVSIARSLFSSDFIADELAIHITRANALLFSYALRKPLIYYPAEARDRDIVVSGGFLPGLTTDACSVLVAEAMGIKKLINISNVDAIYTDLPSKKNAKPIKKLSISELRKLAEKFDKRKAGTNFVFDKIAIDLAERSLKEIHFVGKNIAEIEKAIKGKKHSGTVCYI